jgi:hypothetical protein
LEKWEGLSTRKKVIRTLKRRLLPQNPFLLTTDGSTYSTFIAETFVSDEQATSFAGEMERINGSNSAKNATLQSN